MRVVNSRSASPSRHGRASEVALNFPDAAVRVLTDDGGGPLHFREITDRARERGLINPRSETPWTYMSSAILQDMRRRKLRGESPRFAPAGRGYYRLKQPASAAEEAVLAANSRAKSRLRNQLRDMDPVAFESLVADLLELAGFEEIETTQRSSDGGIDVRAVLTVGGLARVVTAIQVKRWRRNIPIEVVRALRGSLNPNEQGLIVTLSDFTKDSVIEGTAPGRAPIGLLNGESLVDLLAEYGLGFERQEIVLLSVDEELVSGRIEQATPATRQIAHSDGVALSARYSIFRVPGGQPRMHSLAAMLHAVTGQPVTDYVAGFSRVFPKITRLDMAERHMRVLVALGLCEIVDERIHQTADGVEFLGGNDELKLELLRVAFTARLFGGTELVQEASAGLSEGELFAALHKRGLDRLTKTQLRYLVDWYKFLWPVL
jgi:restriction system protein